MKKQSLVMATCVALALVLGLVGGAWAGTAGSGQASITLTNANAVLGNCNDTAWTLVKDTAYPNIGNLGTATWAVTATKGATTHNFLSVNGYVEVQNTGSAPATIGNIVVNLQKQVGNKWVSAAADVADATSGDTATSANIIASASSENKASFTETAASGTLEFTDANNNTTWAIRPQQTIAVGQSVKLFFTTTFDNTLLNIPVGASVRAEVIVTFGNSGARGGSGSSGQNIDINGNGKLDADEANVRSVPTRFTLKVPALYACNASVNLTDPRVSTTGTVTVIAPGFDNGGIGAGSAITDTTTPPLAVNAPVDGGTDGGTITNTAYLDGQDYKVSMLIGYDYNNPIVDPVTGASTYPPIYHDFTCCYGIHKSAPSTVTVGAPVVPFSKGDFVTFNQGQWGQKDEGINIGTLKKYFATVYTLGSVEIGIPGAGDAHYSMVFQSKQVYVQVKKTDPQYPGYYATIAATDFIIDYLPANGTAAALTADTMVNPIGTSSGSLGGETLALKFNVDFSGKAGDGMPLPPGFGDLIYYNNPGSIGDFLIGSSVSQILAAANQALGGGGLPTGCTSYDDLAELLNKLNRSFENGNVTGNPGAYLRKP